MSFHNRRKPTPEVEPVPEASEKPIRFAVRSLGWVRIAEEDLTPERSSKAVNKCIVDLSLGRNDINDVVGRWGDVSMAVLFCLTVFHICSMYNKWPRFLGWSKYLRIYGKIK